MTGLMFNRLRDDIGTHLRELTERPPSEGVEKNLKDLIVVLKGFYQRTENAAKFVFADEPPRNLFHFAKDLVENDMFGLPFSSCYIQVTCRNETDTGTFGYFAITEDATVAVLPTEAEGFSTPFKIAKNTPLFFEAAADEAARQTQHFHVATFMTAIAFLNTKGTKLERIVPKEGINEKRARKGQRPIPEYTVVRIDPEIIKSYTARGGTHASPRPHPRRGHVATIYRGTDKERKIVKPPCFVNASGDLPPPQYFVKKKAS